MAGRRKPTQRNEEGTIAWPESFFLPQEHTYGILGMAG